MAGAELLVFAEEPGELGVQVALVDKQRGGLALQRLAGVDELDGAQRRAPELASMRSTAQAWARLPSQEASRRRRRSSP